MTPILIEHDHKTWEANGPEIIGLLEKYQMIIPEYFPPDFEPHLEEHPLLDQVIDKASDYYRLNFAFYKIADFAQQSNIPVWVVDPAYSEAFVKLRISKNIWMPLVGGVATPLLIKLASARRKTVSTKSTLTRKAISASAGVAIGSTIGAFFMGEDIDITGVEQDLRHTFIAESLVQLASNIDAPTKAVIIYPQGHWYGEHKTNRMPTKGILYYLQNPDERTKQFIKYSSKLSEKPQWEDFFKIRGYTPTQDGWEQTIVTLSSPNQ